MDALLAKQDQTSETLQLIRQDGQQQAQKLNSLESQVQEHNELFTGTLLRLKNLEETVQALNLDRQARARSPTPPPRDVPHVSATPSPRGAPARDIESELQIVIGGWQDAKVIDAEMEARNMFSTVERLHLFSDAWAPYNWTSFLKITLVYGDIPLSSKRSVQGDVVAKLKALQWKSGVPGSEGRVLWCTRNRSVEDRNKIHCLVSCKEFLLWIPPVQGVSEEPKIAWRGQLFMGVVQLIGHSSEGRRTRWMSKCWITGETRLDGS